MPNRLTQLPMAAHFSQLLLFFELAAPTGAKAGAFAYHGRCKFPNKAGIYGSYSHSHKYLTLVYEPPLKAWEKEPIEKCNDLSG
jgi:hypothetical protein